MQDTLIDLNENSTVVRPLEAAAPFVQGQIVIRVDIAPIQQGFHAFFMRVVVQTINSCFETLDFGSFLWDFICIFGILKERMNRKTTKNYHKILQM